MNNDLTHFMKGNLARYVAVFEGGKIKSLYAYLD